LIVLVKYVNLLDIVAKVSTMHAIVLVKKAKKHKPDE